MAGFGQASCITPPSEHIHPWRCRPATASTVHGHHLEPLYYRNVLCIILPVHGIHLQLQPSSRLQTSCVELSQQQDCPSLHFAMPKGGGVLPSRTGIHVVSLRGCVRKRKSFDNLNNHSGKQSRARVSNSTDNIPHHLDCGGLSYDESSNSATHALELIALRPPRYCHQL